MTIAKIMIQCCSINGICCCDWHDLCKFGGEAPSAGHGGYAYPIRSID